MHLKFKLLIALLTIISNFSISQENSVNVMPYPKSIEFGKEKLFITPKLRIELLADNSDHTLEVAVNRMFRRLNLITLSYFEQEKVKLNELAENATIKIQVENNEVDSIGIDESYKLSINSNKVFLSAKNRIGALRGIETILQLVSTNATGSYFPEVEIQDEPRFKWRGMMVDVARHFIPIDILKRNIDAMSAVKMNVLHLHLSDDEGFRVESKIYPKLHEMGSNGQYYTQSELKDLVQYANLRGIMIYPEFDLPGHSTSWFAGYPELASAPGPYKPGPRFKLNPNMSREERNKAIYEALTPTFDPTNEEVYKFFDKFIGEMTTIFSSPYLHIGADENNGKVWENNPQIKDFMSVHGILKAQDLQKYFAKRMYEILKKYNKKMIGWEEIYNNEIPNDITIQLWGGSGKFGGEHISLDKIQKNSNPVIISTGFYLDLFLPAFVHYNNPNIPTTENLNVFGGEAALWSELIDENTFEGRAWPRAAVIAERLWSSSEKVDVDDMYRRMFILSDRLEITGLKHNTNAQVMLASLCNMQEITYPLQVLQTLSPKMGYIRLGHRMNSPERIKYQSVPLVDLEDIVSCDSKASWEFNNLVIEFSKSKNTLQRNQIKDQLKKWIIASNQTIKIAESAPNLVQLKKYAEKISKISEIGILALTSKLSEKKKALLIKQLDSISQPQDLLDINILPAVKSLLSDSFLNLYSLK